MGRTRIPSWKCYPFARVCLSKCCSPFFRNWTVAKHTAAWNNMYFLLPCIKETWIRARGSILWRKGQDVSTAGIWNLPAVPRGIGFLTKRKMNMRIVFSFSSWTVSSQMHVPHGWSPVISQPSVFNVHNKAWIQRASDTFQIFSKNEHQVGRIACLSYWGATHRLPCGKAVCAAGHAPIPLWSACSLSSSQRLPGVLRTCLTHCPAQLLC